MSTHRPASVGGTSSRASSDGEMRHSFPCTMHDEMKRSSPAQPSPGIMFLMSFPRHERCVSRAQFTICANFILCYHISLAHLQLYIGRVILSVFGKESGRASQMVITDAFHHQQHFLLLSLSSLFANLIKISNPEPEMRLGSYYTQSCT